MTFAASMGLLSGIIQLASVFPYLRSMFSGTTRPNAVSFFVWTILGVIEIGAQLSAGVTWPAVITLCMTIGMVCILGLSLIGYGYRAYGWLDLLCLACALMAIIGWYVTQEPFVALAISILGNVSAAVPTAVKAYLHPETENFTGWAMACAASLCALVSVQAWTPVEMLMPMYLVAETSLLTALAWRGATTLT